MMKSVSWTVHDEVSRSDSERWTRAMNNEVGELSLSEGDELGLERDNRRIVIMFVKYRSFLYYSETKPYERKETSEKGPKA